jgi:thiol-disulfide isomerase/thioredoxin
MSRRALVLLPVAAVVLLLVVAGSSSKQNIKYVEVSGPLPAIEGSTLGGGSLSAGDYRGKVVVVNFWASWCAPCRREQPGLEALSRQMEGVMFIGVDYRDIDADARAYLREFGVTYPSVTDPVGTLGMRFDVPYLPTTVIADRSGRLRFRLAGPQEAEDIRALVEALQGEEAAAES